jgi:hypothetical protein
VPVGAPFEARGWEKRFCSNRADFRQLGAGRWHKANFGTGKVCYHFLFEHVAGYVLRGNLRASIGADLVRYPKSPLG